MKEFPGEIVGVSFGCCASEKAVLQIWDLAKIEDTVGFVFRNRAILTIGLSSLEFGRLLN